MSRERRARIGRRHWVRAAQVSVGLLFVVAGLGKLGDVAGFAEQLHNFRLLPAALENGVAICLPWVELLSGLALVLGIRARSGALLATILMVLFTAAVAAAMIRGLDLECGCFGSADTSRVGVPKLIQNAAILFLGGVAMLPTRRASPGRGERSTGGG